MVANLRSASEKSSRAVAGAEGSIREGRGMRTKNKDLERGQDLVIVDQVQSTRKRLQAAENILPGPPLVLQTPLIPWTVWIACMHLPPLSSWVAL
jgi:hypothetical protein